MKRERILKYIKQFYVCLRPFLREFLSRAKEKFELIVFTASDAIYAKAILNIIENGNNKYFDHKIYKDFCIIKENFYVFKNLEVLTSNRNLKDIIIIDNLVNNFGLFICNGIQIIDFTGNKNDNELTKLNGLLEEIYDANDVREVIKENIVHFLINQTK